MKSGRLSTGTVELAEVPEPTAAPGEIVVTLAACGICGTDLEKLRGNYRTAGRLGHEPVGVVHTVGEGTTGIAAGDRVFVHHHVPCYECEVCRRGDLTFCPSYSSTNIDPGGFSERFRVPSENVRRGAVLKLGDAIGWDEGALLEPAACALTALRRVGLAAGDTVFVVGLGPVGLLYQRVARTLGARWVGGSELSEARRHAAERGGADLVLDARSPDRLVEAVGSVTGGRGVDLSVAATGAPAAIALAAKLVRRGGTLNLFGLPERGSRLDVDLQDLYLRGLRVIPTYATTEKDIRELHDLLVQRRLAISDLVTDRIPLDRISEAFDLAGRPDRSVKVVVTGPAYG